MQRFCDRCNTEDYHCEEEDYESDISLTDDEQAFISNIREPPCISVRERRHALFRVFFMAHKGSIEAKYTTNKGLLPDELLNEMREAFKRSEVFLDLELREEDPLLKQKDQMQKAIAMATPEQLGKMQEALRSLGVGNIGQASA